MNDKGITSAIADMNERDTLILSDIERPNIHGLAKRAGRKVKVNKRPNGSFLVTCMEVLAEVSGDKGEKK